MEARTTIRGYNHNLGQRWTVLHPLIVLQASGNERGEKGLDPQCTLKMEQTELSGAAEMEYEREGSRRTLWFGA